ELVPFNVAVIDRDYKVITANQNFEEFFGMWENKRCFEVCKKLHKPCRHCKVEQVFASGETLVSDEAGIRKDGKPCHYVVHLAPLKDDAGNINYVIEMSTDVTETSHWQREYNILFERVPNYITILDRNYRIIRANEKFRQTFGERKGKHCYEVYKKKQKKCVSCPAALTFRDGIDHTSTQVGVSANGDKTFYIVNTTPLSVNEEGVQLVMEIATDITELTILQEQLSKAHDFYATLIENSAEGIIAIDQKGKTKIFNRAAGDILSWPESRKPVLAKLRDMLPPEFFSEPDSSGILVDNKEIDIRDTTGDEIPVRFDAFMLKSKKEPIGRVAFIQDLREIRELEKEKLDAERLGAVGQTVAGLAHTIKNLLMGLEGGIYIVDTGLSRGDAKRIYEGWDILQRNFDKTTSLVKDFLSFSKGRLPELKYIDPNMLVRDIVELYTEAARAQNVELKAELSPRVSSALLDPGGMEACLTNLVSNAIDAAMLGDNEKGVVLMRTRQTRKELIFEVEDNGIGMDSEVIQKVFTTFFTTKGNKGTGLGLLTTHKIVTEHGGKIEVDSDPGSGSTFRIVLPLKRLEMIAAESNKKSNEVKNGL
ncbi:MAG: PAS domain-containing sensor histidine kinase, partial [Bacteroidota bacterium]